MVRAVMGRVALVACALALWPSIALAEPAIQEDGETGGADYSVQLDGLSQEVQGLGGKIDAERTELVQHLITLETLVTPEPVSESVREDKTQEQETLEHIDETLGTIQLQLVPEEVVIQEQEPMAASVAALQWVAYANVSPTGTYANYAIGYLPRMGYGEHYVFLQDTSSSYVMAWGALKQLDGTTIGGSAKWVRWYFQSNAVGYRMESGENDVTVSTAGHVVMSDLDGWPMLAVNDELLRREVAFYAVTACCLFVLAGVLGFTVRLRGAVSV